MERYKEGMTMLIVNCSVLLLVGCRLLVGFWLFCWLFVRLVGWLVGSEREARIHRGQDANCQLFGWFLVVLLVAGWLLAV